MTRHRDGGSRELFERILEGQEKIMATLQELSDAVDAIGTGLTNLGTSLTAEIARLDALIAAGGATAAQLQPIVDKLNAQKTAIDGLKTQADTAT
jgi:ABC-type transporter Mla subunit MlaD